MRKKDSIGNMFANGNSKIYSTDPDEMTLASRLSGKRLHRHQHLSAVFRRIRCFSRSTQVSARYRLALSSPEVWLMWHTPANLKPSKRLAWFRAQPRNPGDASFFRCETQFKCEAVKVSPSEYFGYQVDFLVVTPLREETR